MLFSKEEIGAVLKKMRIDAGLTQKEVAQIIGRNQPIIGHWENGYSQPDVDTLFRLCDIYGVEDVFCAFGFEKEKPATFQGDGLKESESVFMQLSPQAQQAALDYMKFLRDKEAAGK